MSAPRTQCPGPFLSPFRIFGCTRAEVDEIEPPIDTDDETGQDTDTETNPEDTFWRDWFENSTKGKVRRTWNRQELGPRVETSLSSTSGHFCVGGASMVPFQGIHRFLGRKDGYAGTCGRLYPWRWLQATT